MPQRAFRRKSAFAKAFFFGQPGALSKFDGGNLLTPFHFDGCEAQMRCMATRNVPVVRIAPQRPWRVLAVYPCPGGFLVRHRFSPDLAGLSAKKRVSARPRGKAADAIEDFWCWAIPINAAVFSFKNRRVGRFGVILWTGS